MADHGLNALKKRPLLMDGGMGRELQFRGVDLSPVIWSASALLRAPEAVRKIHRDYIRAGADIITTNSYGLIRSDLSRAGLADRYEELNTTAGRLAREACEITDRPVLVAGSLPPLRGSFRPDLVGPESELVPAYREQARLLAPHADLLLCETMSSAAESHAAVAGAITAEKPVWVSWTLHEDNSGRLRSGETISQALSALKEFPVAGFLVNCSSPISVNRAIPLLTRETDKPVGGYANTFFPIPSDWRLDGDKEGDGLLSLRHDLGPEAYAGYALQWIREGASVVGGCCGTRPAHIQKIHDLLKKER